MPQPKPKAKPRRRAKKKARPLLTMSAYAEHRGVSRRAVDKALRDGRISSAAAAKNDRGHWQIDAELADQEWDANSVGVGAPEAKRRQEERAAAVEEQARRLVFGPDVIPVDENGHPLPRVLVQTMRDAVSVQRESIELATLRGELVPRADATRAFERLARDVTNGVLAIPARLASALSRETEEARCEILLEQALVQALRALTEANLNPDER